MHINVKPLNEDDDPYWFELFCEIERHARCGEIKMVIDPLAGIVFGSVVLPGGKAELVNFRF